jgi:hypothetical protein
MIIYMDRTDSLGDFMNSFPVLKGIYDSYGKYDLVIKSTNRKFNGFTDMLMYQDIFNSVTFDDEAFIQGALPLHVMDPYSEETENPNRPAETCRWANSVKPLTGLDVTPDDTVTLKVPELNLEFDREKYLVGDRWTGPGIDTRRATGVLSYIQGDQFGFINYENPMLVNCYLIKHSNKPFITNLTGISVLADLLRKDMYVVWKPEDWHPHFRRGENVLWDGGKDIHQTYLRHHYADRNSKLVHAKDLPSVLGL